MDYADYLLLKFLLLVAVAFSWGVYCGLTSSRQLSQGKIEAKRPGCEDQRAGG